MRRLIAFLLFLLVICLTSTAHAADLRRPYVAAHAVSYGYDNSSTSGCTDYNCGSICYNGHGGSDFPLVFGTNVLAGADGVVTATNNSCADYGSFGNTCGGRCGNYVQLRHPNGDLTIYCHMRRNSLTVSTGQNVSCGQVIGQSASSGSSTGPHLHLGWRPGGGSSTDVYSGSCNNSPGAWRQQNAYGQAPGASCGCVPSTEVCDGQDNNCDGTVDSGDVCEIDLLLQAPHAYAPPVTTDVTGDGNQEICARFSAGLRCFRPTDDSFEAAINTTLMAESNGWGHPQYYSTFRMGDINGNGLADACARHSQGFTCWTSTGDGFEEFDTIGWSNAGGWDRPMYYTTIRLADINGDGRADVCARGASGWRCHLSTPEGFGPAIHGPEWSNAAGYNRARYYGTIRVADIDDDGKDDVCMRTPDGFACYRSTGDGFEPLATEGTMTDSNGWGNIIYWPSIRLADIDGDGTKALCARNSQSLFCQRFEGDRFGDRLVLGNLSNDSGWADPTNYATLRVGDVTGDGSDELCIRANARMLCYRVDGDSVTRFNGPEWSNANGWEPRSNHSPLFITNLLGGAEGSLCGRSPEGLRCATYNGDDDFTATHAINQWTNAGGWTARKYYSTLRMGQAPCRDGRCEPEPEPEPELPDPQAPQPNNPDPDPKGGDDVGHDDDTDLSLDHSADMVAHTSSCSATTGSSPTSLIALLALLFLTLRLRRPLRTAPATLALLACSFTLGACDRNSDPAPESPALAEAPIADAPAPAAPPPRALREDLTLLAVHGPYTVYGQPRDPGHGTDGPRQFEPLLLHGDQEISWPFRTPVISEALFVGDEPQLFVLSPAGTLESAMISADGLHGDAEIAATQITSQLSVATDACCLAFIREHDQGQTLDVLRLDTHSTTELTLGYSLGWAPVVAPGGAQVIWTASPQGHAALLHSSIPSHLEPQTIVNPGSELDPDDLEPFPQGVHAPIWYSEGIAFDAGHALVLIDVDGRLLATADARYGMFFDALSEQLEDSRGEPITWVPAP